MSGRLSADVLVIGGGATGLGVVRDAAMRGYSAILVERGDLGEGTTGRFHGLLHSGGRYVVSDPHSAAQCMSENTILRRIAPEAIEDTGGLFVSTPDDDPGYADGFVDAARAAGIPAEEIGVDETLRREPRLDPRIRRAFTVPDASVDAWKLLWGHARSAREHGARVLVRHPVVAVRRDGDRVTGALVRDLAGGDDVEIEAGFTLNAGGAWAAQLAALAGCEGVTVVPGRGIMIAMNHRLVHAVINRCAPPGDGDILVPIRTVCVIGTTDEAAEDLDRLGVGDHEVQQMLDDGERLVPGFRRARALRVWAGARPLFKDERASAADTRHMSRGHALLDHRERDGVSGFLTITGGKATTFRLMAEDTVDLMCEQLGDARPCRTAEEPLPPEGQRDAAWLPARLAAREASMHDDQLVCECELVGRARLEEALGEREAPTLDDLRRALRLGMGPCQGGFCMYRAAGILHAADGLDARAANTALLEFLQERWKGVQPILYGDQHRQAVLDDWIFRGVLDAEHLPT